MHGQSSSATLGSDIPHARFTPQGLFDGEEGGGQVAYGIVHVFRVDDNAPSGSSAAVQDDALGTVLAIIGMPAQVTASALLSFIEPAIDAVQFIRIINQVELGRSIVLLKFSDALDAEEFYKMFHHQPFDALDDTERCELVYITGVSVSEAREPPNTLPLVSHTEPWPVINAGALAHANTPSRRAAAYELPTCPVCLDRMDSSVTGLMTITCQHTFHCKCLQRWTDSRCPVCRYSRSTSTYGLAERESSAYPTSTRRTHCGTCGSTENLWVCLICAAVGCGRYQGGHARQHSHESGHLYALEIETQRVWDYAGDGYVHRLIQSQTDGKLVELPSASGVAAATPEPSRADREALSGKMDALSLEYSDLIVSQLDSQRAYYEHKLESVRKESVSQGDYNALLQERDELRKQTENALERVTSLEDELKSSRSAASRMEGQLRKALEAAKALRKQYEEEKSVSDALSTRVERMQGEQDSMQREMADLKENLRDLMFY
ncbi:RING-type E3 ubiquitin transferase [Malassezia cuniculi]|uniref:RING-type E3 ubiquitin transferase n=1 Tax=Malassezia cuniculi TaxID=948313 RepID=A0AAF0ESD3_9BASI|nr:RING-type E3 ubiquitin transferase [Malassezia cuniculi]